MAKEDKRGQDTMSEFSKSIRRTTENYLEVFPNEVDRLSTLTGLLQNPHVDLSIRTTIPQGHICASGIIASPDYQKILMLKHKSLRIWVVPGGHFDRTDLTPENTALREAFEETGYAGLTLNNWHRVQGIPLDIDTHAIPANHKKNEGAHVHYDFRYILRLDTEQNVQIDPNESLGFRWVPIDQVDPKSSIAPAVAKLPLIDRFRGRSFHHNS